MVKITFLGAAGEVTGSCFLLESSKYKILVDCGIFQGREIHELNYGSFKFDPREIDFLLLTHAHLDHCGLIPKLVREGFVGRIFSTKPTKDLYSLVINDAAFIEKEENRSLRTLYDSASISKSISLFDSVDYLQKIYIDDSLSFEFKNAGHIMGSASISVYIDGVSILFSGDLGPSKPLILDNGYGRYGGSYDYVVIESTYGNTSHDSRSADISSLKNIIIDTVNKGGNILIPSFAVERSQELLFIINSLIRNKELFNIPIFFEGRESLKFLNLMNKYSYLLSKDIQDMIKRGEHPFHFNNIEYVQENERSSLISANAGGVIKKDRRYKYQTKIVIAGSGMCTGGRILSHLKKNITAQRNVIIFVGYLAQGTLGREISDGAKSIHVDGRSYRVRAKHYKFSGFSDHGDKDDLLLFLSKLNSVPKGIFCVHSEVNISSNFKNEIVKKFDTSVNIPSIGDVFILK